MSILFSFPFYCIVAYSLFLDLFASALGTFFCLTFKLGECFVVILGCCVIRCLLFGPFGRYYLPMAADMAFFLEGNFGFGNASDNLLIAGETQRINTNIMAFGLGPGFTIFSSSAIGIEALVKYNFARSRFDTDIAGVQRETISRTNQFDFSIGFQFYLGGIEAARPAGNRLY